MVVDWQRRRSEFNHDWLKNRFINNLDGFITIMEMKKPDKNRLMIFLENDWSQWKIRQVEGSQLISSFETEMSPAVHFETGLLKGMDSESREWLKPLSHYMWLERHGIKKKISNCDQWLLRVNAQYYKINRMLDELGQNLEQLKHLLPEFKAFRETCMAFSESISKLPSRILV